MNFRKEMKGELGFQDEEKPQRKFSWKIEKVLPGNYEFGKGKFAEVHDEFVVPPKIMVEPKELGKVIQVNTKSFMLTWNGMGKKPELTVTITR